MAKKKTAHGGKRDGAGRTPDSGKARVSRGIYIEEEEWVRSQERAKAFGMSHQAYLRWLIVTFQDVDPARLALASQQSGKTARGMVSQVIQTAIEDAT